MDKIVILDFGGQTCQLIGRRLREGGYYAEIVPHDTELTQTFLSSVKGVILSGSPYSVYEKESLKASILFKDLEVPVMGICYGIQWLTTEDGGLVESMPQREYGKMEVACAGPASGHSQMFLKGLPEKWATWMSHGDSIVKPGLNWEVIGWSQNHPAVLTHKTKPWFGVQFHPEISHSDFGNQILWNFAEICQMKKDWNAQTFIRLEQEKVLKQVGSKPVLLLISGGVDSSVAAALLLKTLDPEKVFLMYIDTGLMRENETAEVANNLRSLGAKHLTLVDARVRFLEALKGISDPELKRKTIGDTFILVQEEETRKLGLSGDELLAQGTLYTDLIESGRGVGKKAHVIKTHHNVSSPLVEAKRKSGMIVEPLSMLYKDEVRDMGRSLGLSPSLVDRHPFPGPGLGVRILGEITEQKLSILRRADAIFIQELRNRNLYKDIWQAFCVLLSVQSVGVTGDARKYGYVLAIRAVTSLDGMSADVYTFPMKDLLEISTLIVNSVTEIGRVVYDTTSKPPATIEWE